MRSLPNWPTATYMEQAATSTDINGSQKGRGYLVMRGNSSTFAARITYHHEQR